MKYVAEVVTITDDNFTVGEIRSTFTAPDGTTITAPLFEITQTEYETDVIAQAKIDTALVEAQANVKDFTVQYPKLEKAFALVVLDEINALRAAHGLAAYTTQQLKTAVSNKYDSL